ncbi:MAG: hypothetical protein ACFUZC_18825 [Chthoniobacteraceae bacterium]
MEQPTARAADKPALRVAPLFAHGKGQGAFGCVVVTPPVFLTEAEAREVIEEEAKKAGVDFTERGHKLSKVPVPFLEKFIVWEDPKPNPTITGTAPDGRRTWTVKGTSNLEERYRKKSPEQTQEVSRDVELDLTGWNPKKQIGYRFVTREDFETRARGGVLNYEKLPDGTLKAIESYIYSCSSVSYYDVRGAAQRLARGLGKTKEPGTVGVFYDPAVGASKRPPYPNFPSAPAQNGKEPSKEEKEALAEAQRKAWLEYEKAYDATAKAESAEELRSQVRDFIAWLKAQGVI